MDKTMIECEDRGQQMFAALTGSITLPDFEIVLEESLLGLNAGVRSLGIN